MAMRLPFGRRLGLLLGGVLLLSTVCGLDAVLAVLRIEAETESVLHDHVQTERDLADWMRLSSTNLQRSLAIARSDDRELAGYFAPTMAATTSRITALQTRIAQRLHTPAETALSDQVRIDRALYLQARDDVMRLKRTGEQATAAQWLSHEFEPKAATYMASVQALSDDRRTRLDSAVAGIQVASRHARRTLAACTLVSLLASLSIAWLLAQRLVTALPGWPAVVDAPAADHPPETATA